MPRFFVHLLFSRLCVPCALVSQHALGQVLVSSRARDLFFVLPVSIFTGLCSICVLPKVFDWIFLPRLSSLLSFWFPLSDAQGVPFPNQARRSGFSSPVHFFSLRLGCLVLNLCCRGSPLLVFLLQRFLVLFCRLSSCRPVRVGLDIRAHTGLLGRSPPGAFTRFVHPAYLARAV
jgi:hypothetical protein